MTSVILPKGKQINWSPTPGPLLPLSSLSIPWTHLTLPGLESTGCPTHSPVKATHLLRDSCPHCTVAAQIVFQLWAMLKGGILYIVRSFLVFYSALLSWLLKASPSPVPQRPSLSGILWVEQRGVGQAGGDKDIAFSCTQRQPCPPPTFSPSHSQLGIHVRPLFFFSLPFPFIYSALREGPLTMESCGKQLCKSNSVRQGRGMEKVEDRQTDR